MKTRWSSSTTSSLTTIEIRYEIPSGTQAQYHPSPGISYPSITRNAYLPVENGNYQEAYRLYVRLACAWVHGHCFTVGRSLTSGLDHQVCWSQLVPHKTSVHTYSHNNHNNGYSHGDPFGLPDHGYSHQLNLSLTQLGVPTNHTVCEQLIQQLFLYQTGGLQKFAVTTTGTAMTTSTAISPPVASAPSAPVTAALSSLAQNPDYEPDQRFVVSGKNVYTYTAPTSILLNANNFLEHCTSQFSDDDECPICIDELNNGSSVVMTKKCRHLFHRDCIMSWLAGQAKSECPSCTALVRSPQGPGPSGTMTVYVDRSTTFYESLSNGGSTGVSGGHGGLPPVNPIVIHYSIPSGRQASYMEHPGQRYSGTSRTAYLPNTQAGRRLLKRLQFAFLHGFTFMVGTSLTTGSTNTVIWTSIHHKTSLCGGTHGYPDPDFVRRCDDELDALNIPKAEECS